jgi:uncharacterized membrane protein
MIYVSTVPFSLSSNILQGKELKGIMNHLMKSWRTGDYTHARSTSRWGCFAPILFISSTTLSLKRTNCWLYHLNWFLILTFHIFSLVFGLNSPVGLSVTTPVPLRQNWKPKEKLLYTFTHLVWSKIGFWPFKLLARSVRPESIALVKPRSSAFAQLMTISCSEESFSSNGWSSFDPMTTLTPSFSTASLSLGLRTKAVYLKSG